MYSIIVIKSTRTCLVVHDDSVKKYRKMGDCKIVKEKFNTLKDAEDFSITIKFY